MESKGHVVSEEDEELYNYVNKNIIIFRDNKCVIFIVEFADEDVIRSTLFIFFEIIYKEEKYKDIYYLELSICWTYDIFCYFFDLFEYHHSSNQKIKNLEITNYTKIGIVLKIYFKITPKTIINLNKFINNKEIEDKHTIVLKWINHGSKKSENDFFCLENDNLSSRVFIPNDMTKWYYSNQEEKFEIAKETVKEYRNNH